MSVSSEMVDTTKAGRYPVILGDSILNRSNPKEVLTGIRYNHKPSLPTPRAPTSARLTSDSAQQTPGSPQSFHMNFSDNLDRFVYQGQRTTDSSQVVLIFDSTKQAFVMERVNSVFHMNLAATPTNSDADALRQEFPHLEISKSASPVKVEGGSPAPKKTAAPKKGREKTTKEKPTKEKITKEKTSVPRRPAPRKQKEKPTKENQPPARELEASTGRSSASAAPAPTPAVDFALPSRPTEPVAPPKKEKKKPDPDSEEDEDTDDDVGFTVEYPGGKPPQADFGVNSTMGIGMGGMGNAVIGTRTFKQLMQDHDEQSNQDDDADADGEPDFDFEADDDDRSLVSDGPRLPSPVGDRPHQQQQQQYQHQNQQQQYVGDEEEDGDGELDDDLEFQLMNALEEVEEVQEVEEAEEDSDVSEEE